MRELRPPPGGGGAAGSCAPGRNFRDAPEKRQPAGEVSFSASAGVELSKSPGRSPTSTICPFPIARFRLLNPGIQNARFLPPRAAVESRSNFASHHR